MAIPPDLSAYVEALRAQPAAAPFFAEGFDVRMVDLRRICAVQPHVHVEHSMERVQGVDASDLKTVARVTLPSPTPTPLAVQFDKVKNAWIFSSANPNLRVIANFSGPIQPGVNGWGFAVGVGTSYLQVAKYGGRLLLRDGYHRALGLLSRGIFLAPALYKEFSTTTELNLPAGLFSHEVYMSERPPLLGDYLDDQVSATITVPIVQKIVLLQAIEVNTLG